jgi:hypothetical protein
MTEPIERTEKRTANEPEAYVAMLNANPCWAYRDHTYRVISIDGETKGGRKRYTLGITDAGPCVHGTFG